MSIHDGDNFPYIGQRFREERERLEFSQKFLCDLFGIKDPKTIRNWESGISSPTADDLLLFSTQGADVGYIITGTRSPLGLEQSSAEYMTPARRAAAEVALMILSDEDAELILALARRLGK